MTDTTIIVHVFTPGEGLSHACTNLPFTDSKNNYQMYRVYKIINISLIKTDIIRP